MRNFFLIDGYYKNDEVSFSDYIVTDMDDTLGDEPNDNGLTDDDIFFYGLNELDIQNSIADKGNDNLDFIITSYRPYDF